jgi:hypothetical protein
LINSTKYMVTPDGISRKLILPRAGGDGILGKMQAGFHSFYGSFAIWRCNHCTEPRVYGNAAPQLNLNGPWSDHKKVYITCQASGKIELHTFVEISYERVGKECPLPTFPTGGLPCNGSKTCACEKGGRIKTRS